MPSFYAIPHGEELFSFLLLLLFLIFNKKDFEHNDQKL